MPNNNNSEGPSLFCPKNYETLNQQICMFNTVCLSQQVLAVITCSKVLTYFDYYDICLPDDVSSCCDVTDRFSSDDTSGVSSCDELYTNR